MLIPYKNNSWRDYGFPFVTLLIIFINVTLFVYLDFSELLFPTIKLWGFSFSNFKLHPFVSISSIFLHVGYWHLIVNMWFLYLFGIIIEKRLGSLSYFMLYISGGILGNLVHSLFLYGQPESPVIGASGAISAVLGAFMIKLPKDKVKCLFFFIKITLSAWMLFGGWLVYEVINAIYFPAKNVAHWAHIGGFALGIVVGIRERMKRRVVKLS